MDLGSTLVCMTFRIEPIRYRPSGEAATCGSLLGIFTDSRALTHVDSTSRLGEAPLVKVPEPAARTQTANGQYSGFGHTRGPTERLARFKWQWFDVGLRRGRKV